MDAAELARELAPTGTLVASINLGNPVLAQGTADDPTGVTVDLAREIARRLDVPLELRTFTAAKDSFAALVDGDAGLAFMAAEPQRAEQVTFSAPYALIEGVFAVPEDSPISTAAEVDSAGVRIGVKEGSAYDLHLTRTVQNATLVRGSEGTTVFAEQGLEAGAGIRQPVTEFVRLTPGYKLVDDAFMQIRQAVAVAKDVSADARTFLHDTVEELKASGFVADSLERSGQGGVRVAPAESA